MSCPEVRREDIPFLWPRGWEPSKTCHQGSRGGQLRAQPPDIPQSVHSFLGYLLGTQSCSDHATPSGLRVLIPKKGRKKEMELLILFLLPWKLLCPGGTHIRLCIRSYIFIAAWRREMKNYERNERGDR